MLKIISLQDLETALPPAIDAVTLAGAKEILTRIEQRGEAALREAIGRYENRPEDSCLVYRPHHFAAGLAAVPQKEVELLERVAQRIERFAQAQRDTLGDLELEIAGGRAGHRWVPLQTAGCYVPGGRFPLVSSLLMTAVTARVAGVTNIWVASPVASPLMLAAAAVAKVDGLLHAGGAQAIGALAGGCGEVPRCDVIVGPGNRWVTAAKLLVSERVRIDMLAGPSELLIVADEAANPETLAADLLAQAEHDSDARPMLVTNCAQLVAAVNAAVERQLAKLPTASNARAALKNGFALIVGNWDEAVLACETIAPEHLELQLAEAQAIAKRLSRCGCLFIGERSAEVLGDYGAGPNHVLPTGGTARYASGLGVETFLRRQTWLEIDSLDAAVKTVEDAVELAQLEGLPGHAASAAKRLTTVRP
jgi:phosphoribosyl-ATP pyrophosphohydrolase/phosphoribosyl-AMP cyclohydrolase/histidinol dehydrogenase